MNAVVTLIADPSKQRLAASFADTMSHLLTMQGVAVASRQWLKEGVACDLFVSGKDIEALDGKVQEALRGQVVDAIVQKAEGRRKKLLIADMESTIITCECLDELAEIAGIKSHIAAITARAMNGEIDFAQALNERVSLLKGLPEAALQAVYDQKVRLVPGAKELIGVMRKNGAYCMLVSGGFEFYTSRIKEKLGFDEARANRLEIEDGKLTGKVIPPILGKDAKLQALKDTCKKLGIAPEETLAVGDGANDLPMLMAAGLGVAYHAKPTVRAQAKARVNHSDLTALLYAQGYPA